MSGTPLTSSTPANNQYSIQNRRDIKQSKSDNPKFQNVYNKKGDEYLRSDNRKIEIAAKPSSVKNVPAIVPTGLNKVSMHNAVKATPTMMKGPSIQNAASPTPTITKFIVKPPSTPQVSTNNNMALTRYGKKITASDKVLQNHRSEVPFSQNRNNFLTSINAPVRNFGRARKSFNQSINVRTAEIKPSFKEMANKFTKAVLDKEISGLKAEFDKEFPNRKIMETLICKEFYENKIKNINNDVPLLGNGRVVLRNVPIANSYINASYVPSENNLHRLIITQHPMKNTILDFLQMILQEKAEYIIQLANISELEDPTVGVEYIPKEGFISFDGFQLNLVSREIHKSDKYLQISTISCKYNEKPFTFKHILWLEWPLKGCPKPWDMTSVTIYDIVVKSVQPIVIHCTSGVRRSGIVAGIILALDEFNCFKLKNNMIDIVKNLRNYRSLCIRTPTEYLFLHLQMLHFFLNKSYIENSQRLMEIMDDYDPAHKKQLEIEKNKGNISAFGITTLRPPCQDDPNYFK
uniref:TYR_PHOSPHATASE_2 domain-containing protein n=1 Tax=Parastrongyloides trichosuri TaxID=131310 RepID=A0A0N4ZU96_PARTI